MAECIVESCAVISSVFSRILVDKLRQSREPIRKQKKRRFWVRKWILERDAEVHRLIDRELRCSHPEDFKNMLRMSGDQFDYLLEHVSQNITKWDTNMRQAISANTKLQVTLRYLATGDSFKSLEYLFRVPKNTISKFVPETCEAIIEALRGFIKVSNKQLKYFFNIRFNLS